MTLLPRALLVAAGFGFVGLGILGLLLPLLPGTPFFLLALACFARSSERFHARLLAHPLVGPTLTDWKSHRVVRRPTKWRATMAISLAFTLSISHASIPFLGRLGLGILGICILGYIWSREEVPSPSSP